MTRKRTSYFLLGDMAQLNWMGETWMGLRLDGKLKGLELVRTEEKQIDGLR